MPGGRKPMTKKQAKKLKADFNADGDFAGADLIDDFYRVQNEMATYRTYEDDEMERRRKELGMTHTVSKKDLKRERKEAQKKKTKAGKSLTALGRFMNKQLNCVFNSQFSFHFDGVQIVVIDTQKSIEQEHIFLYITSKDCMRVGGLLSKWMDIFEQEDRFKTDINLNRGWVALAPRVGHWVAPDYEGHRNNYGSADYNLMEGGFVDVPEASYKKFDMVPAMLCKNEFVFTQEAVRGAGGKDGYRAGARFLSLLCDYYEKEAKKYPHVR